MAADRGDTIEQKVSKEGRVRQIASEVMELLDRRVGSVHHVLAV